MTRITTIGFDADDTLWENEVHYHAGKRSFAALLARHVPEARSLSLLDEIEVRNVGVYGYGIKSFSLSMVEAAARLVPDRLAPSVVQAVLDISKEMLRTPVVLLAGVPEVLERLAADYALLLLTKGDLFEQQIKIARSGIADRFMATRVLHDKTSDVYARTLRELGVPPAEFVMVGNSLRSDIQPALELGARAVFVPHPLTWSHEHVETGLLPQAGWVEIVALTELPDAIRAFQAG